MPITFLTPRAQPVLVLHHRDDDLGDPKRRDGEVVRAQAKRRLADDPGRTRGQQRRRPARPSGPAGRGRRDCRCAAGLIASTAIDRRRRKWRGRGRSPPISNDQHRQPAHRVPWPCGPTAMIAATMVPMPTPAPATRAAPPAAQASPTGGMETMTAPSPPKRHEAHDADVEQARIAPLHVHAQRHDRRDQAHVDDAKRHVPALQ